MLSVDRAKAKLTGFKEGWRYRALYSPLLLTLGVFLLALGPRVLDLNVFVGPDEFSWVTRSAAFTQGLADGDLAKTYQTGHPGITVMWAETLAAWLRYGFQLLHGLADWNTAVGAEKTMAVLSSKRQVVAVVNTLAVALSALLARSVFGSSIAWIAGLLIALDPFLLTEARALRTEGFVTSFNTLALLCLLVYLKKRHLGYAALAGVLTGLALLSKVSAVALLPVGALVVGGAPFTDVTLGWREQVRKVPLALLVWGGVLLLTTGALLPALWVAPGHVITHIIDYVAFRAVEGEGGGSSIFFWGDSRTFQDLSPLFYAVVLPFRTSPWIWVGIGFLAITALQKENRWSRSNQISLSVMLLYVAVYLVLIARSSLKFDRYIIPVLPTFDLLAAIGLAFSWQWLSLRWALATRLGGVAALAVLGSQMLMVLPHHPYYYTYWNPLLGGPKKALEVLPVGSGEGIEKIPAYLNNLPDADTLSLASANSTKIQPLFKGRTLPMTNLDGEWFLADYSFVYISQIQRSKHDAEIVEYLKHKPLEYTFALAGIDYGWLYRGPAAQYFGGDTKLEGRATLHAFSLSSTALRAGQTLTVTVFFRNEGQLPSDRFYVRLVDIDGYIWSEDSVHPHPGFEDAFRTRKAVVEGEAALSLPTGMPAGQYVLKLGYDNRETGQAIGEFTLPAENDQIDVIWPTSFPPPGGIHAPVMLNVAVQDELNLIGYGLDRDRVSPGGWLWLTLFWQAWADVDHDYVVGLQLLNLQGEEVTYWLGRPVRSSLPTDQWRKHQVVQDPWRLTLPSNIPAGQYMLRLTLYDAETKAEIIHTTLSPVWVAEGR